MELIYQPFDDKHVVVCISDGIDVGHIAGIDQLNSDGTKHNYIQNVEVNPIYRGQGICGKMLEFYINTLEPLHYTHFSLHNTGGIRACKCYISSFSACRYSAYKKPIQHDRYRLYGSACTELYTHRGMMYFFKTSHSNVTSHKPYRRTNNKKARKNRNRTRKSNTPSHYYETLPTGVNGHMPSFNKMNLISPTM